MNPSMLACSSCGQLATQLFQCSACHASKYCSRDCQRKDWPTHKELCQELAKNNTGKTTNDILANLLNHITFDWLINALAYFWMHAENRDNNMRQYIKSHVTIYEHGFLVGISYAILAADDPRQLVNDHINIIHTHIVDDIAQDITYAVPIEQCSRAYTVVCDMIGSKFTEIPTDSLFSKFPPIVQCQVNKLNGTDICSFVYEGKTISLTNPI